MFYFTFGLLISVYIMVKVFSIRVLLMYITSLSTDSNSVEMFMFKTPLEVIARIVLFSSFAVSGISLFHDWDQAKNILTDNTYFHGMLVTYFIIFFAEMISIKATKNLFQAEKWEDGESYEHEAMVQNCLEKAELYFIFSGVIFFVNLFVVWRLDLLNVFG